MYILNQVFHLSRLMPVVVLDEIGLAEDSKKMPLKALHSLLENSGSSDQTKIGFIGKFLNTYNVVKVYKSRPEHSYTAVGAA